MADKILILPAPVLHKKCPATSQPDHSAIHSLLGRLQQTMREAGAGAVGLAAPQLGQPTRVAVVEWGGIALELVNPELIACNGSETALEGCLSIPGVYLPIERATAIRVRLTPGSEPMNVAGPLARAIQHEVDHLDGILITQRVEEQVAQMRSDLREAQQEIYKLRKPTGPSQRRDSYELSPEQVLRPKDRKLLPKIVCLCGSTRFYSYFQEVNYQETMAGNIVLSVGYFEGALGVPTCSIEQKLALDELHLRKIDMCDEVYVLNINNYVGRSVKSEIWYARSLRKPIRYFAAEHSYDHNIPCSACGDLDGCHRDPDVRGEVPRGKEVAT